MSPTIENWGKGRTDFSETVSGQHFYIESGATVLVSGQPVWISGQHVYVESGVHVIADVEVEVSSGLFVDGVSGIHVYVESGIFLASGQGGGTPEVMSGQHVMISGQHVYVESGYVGIVEVLSGAHVISEAASGLHVMISGQHVYQESGAFVTAHGGIQVSGTIDIASGAVVVDSGLHVWVSGQHIFVESGAYVVVESGLGVVGGATPTSMSGTYDATADEIITDLIRMPVGGLSGSPNTASGGSPLHSGPILAVEIKALDDNACDIYIGGVNYRPYSGFGYQLAAGEIKDIEINNLEDVYLYPACSGDQVTWMAVV